MKIDVSSEIANARAIGGYESVLNQIAGAIDGYKGNLNGAWTATEVTQVNTALDQVRQKLSGIAMQLRSIESDIISTAQAIRREEDEREAAEIRARQEAERRAREEALKKK